MRGPALRRRAWRRSLDGGGLPGGTICEAAHVMRAGPRRRCYSTSRGATRARRDFLMPPTLDADAGSRRRARHFPHLPAHVGRNTICVATALVECGLLPRPAGAVRPGGAERAARGRTGRAAAAAVSRSRAAVLRRRARRARGPRRRGKGAGPAADKVREISPTGAWYVIVDGADLGLALVPEEGARIRAAGELVKACQRDYPVEHPTFDYPGPDILAFRGAAALSRRRRAQRRCDVQRLLGHAG